MYVQSVTNYKCKVFGLLAVVVLLMAQLALSVLEEEEQFCTDIHLHTVFGTLLGRRHDQNYGIGQGTVTHVVDEYLAVPYGMAERWQYANFAAKWDGVKVANKLGPVCPQVSYYSQTEIQNEDCLTLNIYSPVVERDSDDTLYPVMVFIHGGSYEEGSANIYSGFPMANFGVVVITVNYRLAELGYLTTGDDILPGNYGLMDQILALNWISSNIHEFRGNKSCITLFGSSAGASSVGILLTTPSTKGLFQHAIMQSGSPLAFWAVHAPNVNLMQLTREIAGYVGCPGSDIHDIVQCMTAVKDYKFSDEHWSPGRYSPSWLNFKPRIDYDIIPDFPEKLFRSGKYHNIPVMTGLVKDEWARNAGWFYKELSEEDIDKHFDDGLERQSFIDALHHIATRRFEWPAYIADVITQLYTNHTVPDDPIENRKNYVNFMSDLAMFAPTLQLSSLLSSQETPVYVYEFDHSSEHTHVQWWNAYHSLELNYVFGSPFNGFNIALDEMKQHSGEDKQLSRNMMQMWTDFAKYGYPGIIPVTQHNLPRTEDLQSSPHHMWHTFKADKHNYLHISANNISMATNLRANTMPFWNTILPLLLKSPWQEHNHKTEVPAPNPYIWLFIVVTLVSVVIICFVLVKYFIVRKSLLKLQTMNRGAQQSNNQSSL